MVLSVKFTFGHYLLVQPLREAVMALQHPDLCWNKESDEYTSCINLEGDDLMNALRFTPKTTYFAEEDPDEEDYEELQESIDESPMEDLSSMNDVKNVDRIVTRGGAASEARAPARPARLKARRGASCSPREPRERTPRLAPPRRRRAAHLSRTTSMKRRVRA